MFVIGGKVERAASTATIPNISRARLGQRAATPSTARTRNDGFRSTDFRDVYGTILNKWMGVNPLAGLLTLDTGDPTRNWTVANFNMPLFQP